MRIEAEQGYDQILQRPSTRAKSFANVASGLEQRLSPVIYSALFCGSNVQRRAIGLTSVLPAEGVTTVARALALTLVSQNKGTVAMVPTATLKSKEECSLEESYDSREWAAGIRVITKFPRQRNGNGQTLEGAGSNHRKNEFLRTMLREFDFVILELPALSASEEAFVHGTDLDGILLVIEAGRAKREQIAWAIRTLELAQAKLLGCVLNKRNYPLPEWLHRWL